MSHNHFLHSVLGEITPAMQARLTELSRDPGLKSKPDSFTSFHRAVLFDIASLQTKAIRTFGMPANDAAAWWVTRHSLQQSTHHLVASLKASWMGTGRVADLCCGLGSDLIALARRGPACGLDIDTDVLAFTVANLKSACVAADLRQCDIETGEVGRWIADAERIHIDPDRRAGGQRHTAAQDLVPCWSRVRELLQSCQGGLVKLAPATQVPPEAEGDIHRTWIAAGGSVREQTAIAGEVLDDPWIRRQAMAVGGRSAISIHSGVASVFAPENNERPQATVADADVGQWIIDPDAAIRAAGLTTAFAVATNSQLLGGPSGFLTCEDRAGLAPWPEMAQAARVIDVVGCDDRKLRRWFRAHDGYPDVIKVRGADLDPAATARRMRDCGQTPMGLWIGRIGKRTYAAITDLTR